MSRKPKTLMQEDKVPDATPYDRLHYCGILQATVKAINSGREPVEDTLEAFGSLRKDNHGLAQYIRRQLASQRVEFRDVFECMFHRQPDTEPYTQVLEEIAEKIRG
jgi:hypothetical protein